MPKKRLHERPEGVHFWGSTDAIETRIRKLGEDVRALRKELTDTSRKLAAVNDKRLPSPPDETFPQTRPRSRKRR